MTEATTSPIGIIGGSGLYDLIEDAGKEMVDTPYGAPSSPVATGRLAGRDVAFITRHGEQHELAPHTINYRANLWALHDMGVRRLITSSAVGSLRAEYEPGEFVLCDQFVDRTTRRIGTFFDGPRVIHVSVADPYCSQMREVGERVLSERSERYHPTGTAVVIEGPRFSTRAESRWFQQMGWDVLSMTQYPETVLARELAMCCFNLSFISDHDAGVDVDDEPVTAGDVWRRMAENQDRIRGALGAIVEALPTERTCRCPEALTDV